MIYETLRRTNMKNLVNYLLYGAEGLNEQESKNDSRNLDAVFDNFYCNLKKEYPEIETDNDSIFLMVTEMLTAHDEVYMELGFMAGAQLMIEIFARD